MNADAAQLVDAKDDEWLSSGAGAASRMADHAVGFAKTRLSFALDRVKDKDEEAADAIRDVLDQVTGWCSPQMHLSGPEGDSDV